MHCKKRLLYLENSLWLALVLRKSSVYLVHLTVYEYNECKAQTLNKKEQNKDAWFLIFKFN